MLVGRENKFSKELNLHDDDLQNFLKSLKTKTKLREDLTMIRMIPDFKDVHKSALIRNSTSHSVLDLTVSHRNLQCKTIIIAI